MIAPPPKASELEAALQAAVLHHRAGRLLEAEQLYRGILQVRPDHAPTNNNQLRDGLEMSTQERH